MVLFSKSSCKLVRYLSLKGVIKKALLANMCKYILLLSEYVNNWMPGNITHKAAISPTKPLVWISRSHAVLTKRVV